VWPSSADRGEDAVVDLDAVADELYGLTPGEFTTARQARAADARQTGDRDLAAAIGKLRRPTTGAWLVNLLRRERTDELMALLNLGEVTRQAQAGLDADAMSACRGSAAGWLPAWPGTPATWPRPGARR
jgi:hypothetical protein